MNNQKRFWSRIVGFFMLAGAFVGFILLWVVLQEENPAKNNNAQEPVAALTEESVNADDTISSLANEAESTAEPVPTAVSQTNAATTAFSPQQPLPVLSDISLSPKMNPHTYETKSPSHQFTTYIVDRNETPGVIAEKFGISSATLLGGNPSLSKEAARLQSGAELIILPIDGALHTVRPGEKLEDIAKQYDIPVEDIIAYAPNNLEFPFRLVPETQLLIPGAEIGVFYWKPPKTIPGGNQNWAVVGTGTFTWPVSGRCLTQFPWYGHPAIDISTAVGNSLYAADTGTVTYASWAEGNYYDYGNLIVINHGNGFETLYGHLDSIGVRLGQTVTKGDWIGTTGNTGRSSGPHLHLEIRLNDIRLDPLNYLFGPVSDCT